MIGATLESGHSRAMRVVVEGVDSISYFVLSVCVKVLLLWAGGFFLVVFLVFLAGLLNLKTSAWCVYVAVHVVAVAAKSRETRVITGTHTCARGVRFSLTPGRGDSMLLLTPRSGNLGDGAFEGGAHSRFQPVR